MLKRGLCLVLALVLLFGLASLFTPQYLTSQTTEAWTDDLTTAYRQDVAAYWWNDVKSYFNNKIAEGDSATRRMSPEFLGQSIEEEGRILLPIRNKAGSTLALGVSVVWDSTGITICDTLKEKPARILIDLSDEGGWLGVIAVAAGTASNDTLDIYGLDEDGAAQTENLAITDGAASRTKSAYRWTQIDSVDNSDYTGGWDSYILQGIPYCGVTSAAGATYTFAGVIAGRDSSGTWVDWIIDNGVGYIVIQGVTAAVVDGNSTAVYPGMLLTLANTGDFAPFAHTDSSDTGKPVVRALEAAFVADAVIDVFIF